MSIDVNKDLSFTTFRDKTSKMCLVDGFNPNQTVCSSMGGINILFVGRKIERMSNHQPDVASGHLT